MYHNLKQYPAMYLCVMVWCFELLRLRHLIDLTLSKLREKILQFVSSKVVRKIALEWSAVLAKFKTNKICSVPFLSHGGDDERFKKIY